MPFILYCARISLSEKQVSVLQIRTAERITYGRSDQVFRGEAEAKRLLESEKVLTIQEAVDAVGISRSSFYKYKDDIFPFHDNSQGTTITLTFQMDDEPGILSDVLKIIAEYRANILTIHQSIPINGIASLTLSIQVLQTTGDISRMIEQLEGQTSVHHVKILAKE